MARSGPVLKVAVVGPAHPYAGGAAQHTTFLAHRLAAAGHDVALLSWRALYPRLLYPGQPTVTVPEVEPFPGTERPLAWHRPDTWWLTGRRLARHDAVLLAVFTPLQAPAYWTLAQAARAGGCRVIALCHNVLPHERRWFDEPAMRILLRPADAVVVHSAQQAAIAATVTRSAVQIAALPLHLPGTTRQVPAAAAAAHVRRRLLFFGIVRRYKGVDLLLRALARAGPRVSLTVAGEIWHGRRELLRLISALQLDDRVMLTDRYVPAQDIPGLFAAADALVLPYRSGTASQNALIALQFGLPVIASRTGAIADCVLDGVNGLLCTPGDVDDLASAINKIYQPGTLARLRRGVRPPDSEAAWDAYLAAVTRAITST